ncbi:MAG: DUF523 domain-containing protein [Anaerovoracaceae bacterium]|jgi:uncharacterized protein YbbK (DUF523 family)
MYLISRCLLGENCKYNGGNNRNEAVIRFAERCSVFGVCPECAAGLPAPREPAEQRDGRVVDRSGRDLTEAFRRGAELSLENAVRASEQAGEPIEGAVLKANSPSCGAGKIYDGTFTGRLTDGDGCFVRLLREKKIPVRTEKEIEENGKF